MPLTSLNYCYTIRFMEKNNNTLSLDNLSQIQQSFLAQLKDFQNGPDFTELLIKSLFLIGNEIQNQETPLIKEQPNQERSFYNYSKR
jgi:hypothetical protein